MSYDRTFSNFEQERGKKRKHGGFFSQILYIALFLSNEIPLRLEIAVAVLPSVKTASLLKLFYFLNKEN